MLNKNTKDFNIVHYIELLNKEQNFRNNNTSLYESDKVSYRELLSYKIILESQVRYNRQIEYISLIESYLNNEIQSFLLTIKLYEMEDENRLIQNNLEENIELISNVSIDLKSSEFSILIENIFSACKFLKSDLDSEKKWN